MMRDETDYIAVEPRKRVKYINAPIANPVVLRRMSSISEQWSENGSCDISMSSEKAVPASKVFGKLFNFLKQTGQTIPTGMKILLKRKRSKGVLT